MPADVRATDTLRTRRFRALRVIGAGGMGVVYEAIDEWRGGRVALKTLRTLEAESLVRFKNEFRRLQDIHHPNVVSLGELCEEDGRLFFTMELVDGVHLMQHVRPGSGARPPSPRVWRRADSSGLMAKIASRDPDAPWLRRDGDHFDEAKVRSSFGQLVKALRALHRANKIHRDVKPGNVLVTEAGRVVLVDFGLILDVDRDEDDTQIVGTAHYMAPEQAAGGQVGPEADWYSVGAMLYVALTGFYPFRVPPEQAIDLKQRVRPLRPAELVAEPLPPDLEQLAIDLLERDPTARPGAAEILRRLGVDDDTEPASLAPSGFVGRTGELGVLRAALRDVRRGAAVSLLIEGESGVGKSALLARFLDEQRGATVVLYGRCYERESVPYKAVDEVVDALGQRLARLPHAEVMRILPPDASLLGVAFPTLGRIEAVASATAAREVPDPRENRAQVFAALRELLRRFAARQPLAVAIDDLQWADADGLALLTEILRPPDAPAMLFLATVRSVGVSAIADRLPTARRMPLGPLPNGDAIALANRLLANADRDAPSIGLDALLAEAGGHPLFLDALLRHRLAQGGDAPVRLEDALATRITRLDPHARQLLEVIAVAGRPIPRAVAAHATGIAEGELERLEAALRAQNLARTAGADTIETYHDRIRETVLGRLDPATRRARNAEIGLALEANGSPELEALAAHFREAGDRVRAARYAVRAGDEAAQALAFDRAVELYRAAIELGSCNARALEERLGDALANAGRGAEAAAAYLAATTRDASIAPREALSLRRRAAENYLRSGYFDEGMASLRDVLAGIGMSVPRTPSVALALLLAKRAELRLRGLGMAPRREESVDPDVLERIDVCWSAAKGLGMIDNVRAAYFQTTNVLLALDAGEPYRAARALALEVPFVGVPGSSTRGRAIELLAEADALAHRTGNPHALGLVRLVSGTAFYLVGEFPDAVAELDRAETILRERCTGVAWERASGLTIGLWSRWFTGDLREFCRRVPLAIREAEERGDRYLATNLRSYFTNAHWLIQGDPARARDEAALAIERWSSAGFHLQHMHDMVALAQIALYEGDAREAYRVLDERWAKLEASLSLRMQTARVHVVHLRARAALALAATTTRRRDLLRRRSLLAEVDGAARSLEREDVAWALPLAASLRGASASIRGDAGEALDAMNRAAQGFRAAGMALFAATARKRLGALLGGERGAALSGEATRWMRAQGVVDPDRITRMLAPGFG